MPDQFGGVEIEDEFGGVAVEEESAPVVETLPPRPPLGKAAQDGWVIEVPPGKEPTKTPITLNGEVIPVDVREPMNMEIPLLNSETVRSAVDFGTKYVPNILTIAERLSPGGKEFAEGVRGSAAEMGSGLTTPKSIMATPLFTIPGVGQTLALGMGAEATGAGLGRTVAAIEQGDPRELGAGLVETAGGAVMLAGGAKHTARAPIPPRIVDAITKGDAAGLNRATQALADTVKREQVSDQVQQLEKPIESKEIQNEAIRTDATGAVREGTENIPARASIEVGEGTPSGPAPSGSAPVDGASRRGAVPGSASPGEIQQATAKGIQNVESPLETTAKIKLVEESAAAPALPPEPARAQGGKEAQVLLTPEDVPPAPEKLPNRNPLVQVVGPDGKKHWFTVDGTQDFTGVDIAGKDRGVQRQLTAVDKVPVLEGQDPLPAGGTTYQYRIEEAGYKLPEKLPSDAEIKTYREQQKAKAQTQSGVGGAGEPAKPVPVLEQGRLQADQSRAEAKVAAPAPEAATSAAKPPPELPGTEAETQGAKMGPPLMPAPPTGAPAAPIKPISQIIRDLAKGLDVPIRFGRLTTSKFGGYFKKNPNLIGAKLANDMPIVAHEAGHKLDTIYPFTKDASIFPELEALGDPAVAGSRSSWTPSKSGVYKRSEGLAEFIRHWLTDPAQAQKLAPDTHTLFERVLAANEDLSGTMRQAQSDIQLWKNAPQEARLDSSISRSDPNKSRYRLPNLMRDLVDDLHFLRMAVDDAKVSGPLPPSQNPYQLARTIRGSFGMADTFVTKGIVDFKTKEVRLGTDLETALKPVSGRIDEFRRWIVAKRAKELRAQGKESGLNPADVDFVANKYDADPAFQEAFTKVKAWNDGLLQYSVDAGLISPESATAMRELHQDYVPFHRLFEVGAGESPAVGGGGSGRGLNVGKPGSLKRLSGSQRDIVDPLETMVKNAYTMITAAEKNAINTAVADLAPKTDMGRWVEKVAAPKEMVKVELERIRKQLEDAGADLTNVPDDLLMSFFKPSGRAPFGENIIKVNRAGQQEFYRLNKDLFDTFNALDQDSSSRLLKVLSQPAQILRAGVTLTPDFALSNAIRDTFGAAVNSKYTSYPFQATFRGIGALLNNPKLVSEWAAAGGKQSIEANYFDRAKLQKFVTDRITKDLTPAEQALVVVKSPLTALRKFTGTLEEATRLGEYQAALKQLTAEGMPIGEARRQAAFEARDLQDFAKGGAQTKIVRSLAAFWNAGLQGNIRLAQSFRQRPFQTTLKGLAFITLPKLLEQAVNWNDEDYWDRPQWERDVFFMIPVGKDANNRTQFLRLPTPFEMGIIFGTGPGRMLQSLREKNPEALKDFPRVMLKQGIPNPTPQSILTMLEVNAGKGGYSYFRGRPIVPSSLQNAPPEMQFTSQNSLTARKAGDLMGISPAKVDYAIAGLTGGVGRQLTHQVSDRAISAVTGEERTAESTMPGARFVATPAGTQSEAVERFYKALEEANADAERVKAGLPSQGSARNATRLNRVARELSDLRKLARLENDPVKHQAINLRLAEKARNAFRPTPNPNP